MADDKVSAYNCGFSEGYRIGLEEAAKRKRGGDTVSAQEIAMSAWQVLGAIWGIHATPEQCRIMNWFWAKAHDEEAGELFPLKLEETQVSASIEAELELRCDKCGSSDLSVEYNYRDKRLDCCCRRCEYRWAELPLDQREEQRLAEGRQK